MPVMLPLLVPQFQAKPPFLDPVKHLTAKRWFQSGRLRRDHRCASTRRSNQRASQFVTFGPVVRRLKAAASCTADTHIKEPANINAKESTAIPPRISLRSLTGFNRVGVVAG